MVGAIADGYSTGTQPDVLPRWMVLGSVKFLGPHHETHRMDELVSHLSGHLRTLREERKLSGKACELGAFIYDHVERRLSVYLVCDRATTVIAAVGFPRSGRKPVSLAAQKACRFTEKGVVGSDGDPIDPADVLKLERSDGVLLSSDGFHQQDEREPDWIQLRALLCDGEQFVSARSPRG